MTFDELLQRGHRDHQDCPTCLAYGKRAVQCGCGQGWVHCVWLFRHEALVHPVYGPITVGDYMCSAGGILCKGMPPVLRTIAEDEGRKVITRETGEDT